MNWNDGWLIRRMSSYKSRNFAEISKCNFAHLGGAVEVETILKPSNQFDKVHDNNLKCFMSHKPRIFKSTTLKNVL